MNVGGTVWLIVVLSIGISLVVAVPMLMRARKAFGPSKKDRELMERLTTSGSKARATVLAVSPTGMVVNLTNIGCRVDFRLDPLDGSPSFTAAKDTFIQQTQMPRMGDVWPAWYDAANPALFVVGQPGYPSAEQLAVFAEFGIPHPLAPPGGPTAPPPA